MMRFIRTKCIALLLGPTGTGFLAQLAIFFEVLRIWGDLGSRRAVIKQVAEQRYSGTDASPQYREIVKTSIFLALFASFLVGGIVAFFSPAISRMLYGNASHYPFVIFLACLLPLASLSTVIASIVKGNLDYLAFAKYTLGAYGFVLLLTPVLIYFFGTWGAAATMGLFFLFPMLAYLILNIKKPFLHFSKRLNFNALKEQFSQGFLQIYQDTWMHLIRLAIATWIIRGLGLSTMGIYQVVITFATVYMAIPMHAMSGYVFPLIAASRTPEEVNLALNDSLRFLTFVLVPIIVGVMVLPEMLIRIFFSDEFLAAAPVLQIQLLNTLFLVLGYAYGMALIAKGKVKSVYVISTVQPIVYLTVSWFLFPKWQLMGVAAAAAISGFIHYLLQVTFSRRYFGTQLTPKNVKLILMTFIWISLTFAGIQWFDRLETRIALLAFGLVWFMVSSKNHERQFLMDKISLFFRRPALVKKRV